MCAYAYKLKAQSLVRGLIYNVEPIILKIMSQNQKEKLRDHPYIR